MVSRTATLTITLLAFLAILGALGCSGSDSPVLPGADTEPATVDAGDREVADEEAYSSTLTDSDGDPLAWTEIWLDGELAGWTDEDGAFEIYGLEEDAEVTLEAKVEENVVYSTVLTPGKRTAQAIGDPDPSIERGTVWGFVHDQLGPVPHALVVVFNQTENFGADFSDDEGYFNIPDAPAGPCVIIGLAPEHATGHDTVFVIEGGEVQKNLFLPKKLDFGIVGGHVLTGHWPHMKPIPHGKIELKPVNGTEIVTAWTNKWGVYVMAPIPLGLHQLKASAVCFNQGFRLRMVHPGRNYVGFHLEPAGCGGIEGIVTTPAGAPIPHALVRISHPKPGGEVWTAERFTGPFGGYRFNPLLPGEYLIECFKPGFGPFEQMAPVFPDQFTVINIVLEPDDPGGPGG